MRRGIPVRFTPLFLPVASALVLSGCATSPNSALDNTLQSTLAQPLVTDSVMREGDALSFQVTVPNPRNGVNMSAQFEANCSSSGLYLLYLDGAQRVYPGAPRAYTPARELSAKLHEALGANPTFVQACAQVAKPDWRMVKTDDRNNWVMLDRNSVRTVNGETRLWAAFDNPTVLNDMPYNAPYGQKRELFALNCAAGSYKLLAGYDLDARNRISDGSIDSAATAQPVSGSNADYQAVFALACGSADAIARLEPFKPRHKAPVSITLQSVNPAVLSAISQLNLSPPQKTFKYLRSTGTSNFQGKPGTAGEELFISVDAPSGQLGILARGKSYETQSVSWRGLIPLVAKATYSSGRGMAESSSASQLSFGGDWKNLPVGQTVSYTVTTQTLNSVVGAYGDKARTTQCKVERELNASELNPALIGKAKALSCSIALDQYERVTHDYYLSDYGYFFHGSTDKNRFFYDDYRIESVD